MKPDKDHPLVRFFTPHYNEIVVFQMGVTFVLVFVTSTEVRSWLANEIWPGWKNFHEFEPGGVVFMLFCLAGLFFSLYHVFTRRKKSEFECFAMVLFAGIVNIGSAIAAGTHLLETARGIFLIFPLLNFIDAIILLLMWNYDYIDYTSVHKNTPTWETIFSLLSIVAIFALCHFVYQLYWAITFSICVVFASNLNSMFSKLVSSSLKSGTT